LNFAQYGIEVNFTSSSVSVRSLPASGLSTFGTRLQTPTLIGCLLLKNLSAERCSCAADFSSAKRWDYLSLFDPVSSAWLSLPALFGVAASFQEALVLNSEAHDYSTVFARLSAEARPGGLSPGLAEHRTAGSLRIIGL
jgi:hypothetical protein